MPGYAPPKQGVRDEPRLTLDDFERRFRDFVFDVYHVQPHSETHIPPQQRWEAGGFLPQMPDSLEQLDLLLLTVAKPRKVRRDGIWFLGMRYLDTTLAAYVGESVIIRYDPRDVAEIRVFYQDRFLCRAICQELAGATVPLRDIYAGQKSTPPRPPPDPSGTSTGCGVPFACPPRPSQHVRNGGQCRALRGERHPTTQDAAPKIEAISQ